MHARDDVGTKERAGHGAEGEPAHETEVDGALAKVDPAADGLHHDRGHEITRHGGQRLHPEEDHENRGHQCPAPHAGQAHYGADDQSGDAHPEVEMHGKLLPGHKGN